MRKLLLIGFYVLIGAISLAQSKDSTKLVIRDGITVPTQPLYVLDNAVINKQSEIDTSKIFSSVVLKATDATAIYGSRAAKGCVIITTKQFAIKSYQKKLSEFSKQYKIFIERDKKKDDTWHVDVTYNINGKLFADGQKETITALYNLKKENLTSILIDTKFNASYSPTRSYNIYITTKN